MPCLLLTPAHTQQEYSFTSPYSDILLTSPWRPEHRPEVQDGQALRARARSGQIADSRPAILASRAVAWLGRRASLVGDAAWIPDSFPLRVSETVVVFEEGSFAELEPRKVSGSFL